MEKEINILEILKDKPKNTKLWTDVYGEAYFGGITPDFSIALWHHGVQTTLSPFGKLYKSGRLCVFPSDSMRDWGKFSWKKGDVLICNNNNIECIFEKFVDDTYEQFICKHYLDSELENQPIYMNHTALATELFSLEDKDHTQSYINAIEKRLGRKLNMETLEIENKLELKDGDIVIYRNNGIVIVKAVKYNKVYHHVGLLNNILYYAHTETDTFCNIEDITSYATEEEKQQLFDALAKEGKRWNAETKQLEDIEVTFTNKWAPKPFEKVVVRNSHEDTWRASFFSHIVQESKYTPIYICVGGSYYLCIPYNNETKKLIGTKNDYKEG